MPNWTYDPIVHVTAPGQLAVRCAGQLIGALERGLVVDAALDVFDSQWLPALFERERQIVQQEHAALQTRESAPTSVEHSLIGKLAQQMLRRAIQLIRGARHGGLLLIVDGQRNSAHLRGLRLKYSLAQDEPSHRYRTLLFQILSAVAAATEKDSVGWLDFRLQLERALRRARASRVRTEPRARELGPRLTARSCSTSASACSASGAEVSAELPTPERVWRATDTEGQTRHAEDIGKRGHASPRGVSLRERFTRADSRSSSPKTAAYPSSPTVRARSYSGAIGEPLSEYRPPFSPLFTVHSRLHGRPAFAPSCPSGDSNHTLLLWLKGRYLTAQSYSLAWSARS